MLKKYLKILLKYILLLCFLLIIYFLTLTITSLIPSRLIKQNVKESADYLINKNESVRIDVKYKNVFIFEFTNALMLNTAYSIDNEKPIESFLVARKNYIPGVTKIIHENTPKNLKSAEKYYTKSSKTTDAYQIPELYDTVYENDLYEAFEYARYWHGYLIFLRPLLLLFNYKQIEVLSTIIFMFLLLVASALIYKKIDPLLAIALFISYIAVDTLVISVSMNEITCFILSLIFAIYILIRFDKIRNIGFLFFIIGSITNFVDFLTNPIIVYGIPIIVYLLLLQTKQRIRVKETILIYLKTSLAWGIGYALTWRK